MNSKVIREKREDLLQEMNVLAEKLKTEKRQAFTVEEREMFDGLDRQQEDLVAQAESLERVERLEGMSRSQSQAKFKGDVISGVSERAARGETEERNKAFAGWFYHGSKRQKPEYWRAAERAGIDVSNSTMRFDWNKWETRTGQTISPNSAGGYTVAVDTSMMSAIDVAMKAYGNIFQVATVVETATGAPLPWPVQDDSSNVGEVTGENGTIGQTDMTFGQKQLSAYKYDSGFIKVSWELLNDSVVDLASFVGKQSGIRIGRKLNSDIIGSTSGPITPLTSTATSCGTTTASNSAVTYAEILALYHAVDPAYRDEPGCCWMFNDTSLKILRSLVDGNQRPLLNSSLEGISGGVPTMQKTLLEKVYFINQAFSSGASAKAYWFGDFSKLIIRRVAGGDEGGLQMVRLNERFADTGQVAFLAWGRFDALLSDAGTHPVLFMPNHA